MQSALSLTLNEAGYVVGQSSRAINRAIDREKLRVGSTHRGGAALRTVGPAELRYLALTGEVADDLTPVARRKLYEAVRHLPIEDSTFAIGPMTFRLTKIDQDIAERLNRLTEIKAAVEERSGSEPVLRGTDASPYAVAALARDRSAAEIVADFPRLTPEQIEAARDYAAIYPRAGRPLPIGSFKRMLAGMAESGVWDVEAEEPIAPRPMP